MKAAVLERLGNLRVQEVPDPELDPDSALVRVEAVAICGSDIRIFHHGNPRVQPPAIIGHEIAGVVVDVGKNVTRVKPGNRVAIGADVPCGQCPWCRNGLGNNCRINYAIGYQIPGGFAQFIKLPKLVLDEGPVTPFGDSLSFAEAALAEPLGCVIHGLELAQMGLGKTVVIIGLGPVGCMLIEVARLMGAGKIIAAQRSRRRLEMARAFGADVYVATEEEDLVSRCLAETGGEGADVVMTACGAVEAHEQAIEMVAHRGVVNLFGGLPKTARPMSVLSNTIHYKECFVTGSHGCVPRHHEMAVRLLESGRIRVKELISHHFSLDQIEKAFSVAESREGMKVVIHPNG